MPSLKTLLQQPCGWQTSPQVISSDEIILHLRATRKQHYVLNALSAAALLTVTATDTVSSMLKHSG